MKKIIAMCLALIMMLTPVTAFADTQASPIGTKRTISSGTYLLSPAASKRVLAIEGSSKSRHALAVIHSKPSSSQRFYIKAVGDGTYTIRNVKSGLYLTAKNAQRNGSSYIWQTSLKSGTYAQRWYIFKTGSSYVFQNAACSKVMTVKNGKDRNNVPVIASTYSKSSSQKWTLSQVKTTSVNHSASDESTGMSASQYAILNNIIGAVETGGQVYGKRNYADYTAPYTNSSVEYTITLGWGAFYGTEAQKLIQNIYNADPAGFKKIDSKGLIQKALKKNWVSTRWNPSATEKAVIKKLIVTSVGKKCQDQLFTSLMKSYVKTCQSKYTSNTKAIMMYCEIRHLGGSAVDRIFARCNGNYSVSNILASLKKDQSDTSSNNQVGDAKFWTRHQKCAQFINTYVK